MKRAGLTLLVALLAVMTLPLAALASPVPIPSGTQDQLNHWTESWYSPTNLTDPVTVTQTYKAGIGGRLTAVEIYCQVAPPDRLIGGRGQDFEPDVIVSVGSAHASADCGQSDWMIFTFSNGPVQTAGQTYTISIEFPAGRFVRIGAGDDYANGAAGGTNVPDDFAFGTWVGASAPPTSTETDQAPTGGSALWLVPALLAFALGALAVIRRKQTAPNN